MKRLIRIFYKKFDRFLENSTLGNLRLKAKVTAVLTGVLIFILIIVLAVIAFFELEITVPAEGEVSAIINNTTLELKMLVLAKYQESVKIGQNAKVWLSINDKISFQATITKMADVAEGGNFYVYLENIQPPRIPIKEDLINKKARCRILIDKKKLYNLLLK